MSFFLIGYQEEVEIILGSDSKSTPYENDVKLNKRGFEVLEFGKILYLVSLLIIDFAIIRGHSFLSF